MSSYLFVDLSRIPYEWKKVAHGTLQGTANRLLNACPKGKTNITDSSQEYIKTTIFLVVTSG